MAEVAQASTPSFAAPVRNADLDRAERALFGKKKVPNGVTLAAVHCLLNVIEESGPDAEHAANLLDHAKKADKVFGSAEKRLQTMEKVASAQQILFGGEQLDNPINAINWALHALLDVVKHNKAGSTVRDYSIGLLLRAHGSGMFRNCAKGRKRLEALLPNELAAHAAERTALIEQQRSQEAAARERRTAKQARNKVNRKDRAERNRSRKPSSGGNKEKNDKGKKGK